MTFVSELPGDVPMQTTPSVSSPGVSAAEYNKDVASLSISDVGTGARDMVSPIGRNRVSPS